MRRTRSPFLRIGGWLSRHAKRLWSVATVGLVISQYCHWHPIPTYAPFTFALVLAFYAALKGIELWGNYARRRERGERAVAAWILFFLGLTVGDALSDRVAVTWKMVEVLIDVLAVYALSRLNRQLYLHTLKRKRRRRHAAVAPNRRHATGW